MMFGREPIFPIDTELLLTDSNETEQPTNEEITVAMDRLHSLQREMHSTAATNIKKAQIKQKNYYDSRHEVQSFSIGDKVLVENTAQKQRKGGKLADKWLGPYKINQEIRKGVYGLETLGGNLMKQSSNTSRLKLYFEDSGSLNVPTVPPTEACENVITKNKRLTNQSEDAPQLSSTCVPQCSSENSKKNFGTGIYCTLCADHLLKITCKQRIHSSLLLYYYAL